MPLLYVVFTLLLATETAFADSSNPLEFEFEEIARGVWAGVRPDSPRFPVMGNTTFVISDEGVVVFDGGGLPSMGEQVIGKIRTLTSLPVTHVIISHWHGDHHFGIAPYLEAFPNVQVIAHRFTDRAMRGSTIDYIENYATFGEKRLPVYQQIVDTGKDTEGNEASEHDLMVYRQIIEDFDKVRPDFDRVQLTMPTLLFDDRLVVRSGERTIEVMSLGSGNTEGDIVMWLADEKIVSGQKRLRRAVHAKNILRKLKADPGQNT